MTTIDVLEPTAAMIAPIPAPTTAAWREWVRDAKVLTRRVLSGLAARAAA